MKSISRYFGFLSIFLSFSNYKYRFHHANALDFRRNILTVSVESTKKRHNQKIPSSSLIVSGKNYVENETLSSQKIVTSKHDIVVSDENEDIFEEFVDLKSHEVENALISIQSVIRKKSHGLIKTVRSPVTLGIPRAGDASSLSSTKTPKGKSSRSSPFLDVILGRAFCSIAALLVFFQTSGVILSHNDHALLDEVRV